MNEHAKKLGYRPEVKILEQGTDGSFGVAEQRWIQHYLALGFKLRNIHPGGAGGAWVVGQPQRWSAKGKETVAKTQFKPGRAMSPKAEANRLAAVRQWWAAKSPEERKAMASARTQKRLQTTSKDRLVQLGQEATATREQRRAAGVPMKTNSDFMKAKLSSERAKQELSYRFKKMWADMTPEYRANYLKRRAEAYKAAIRKRNAARSQL